MTMLRSEDFVREFPINLKTDRDAESPILKEWIEKISPIESLLDVGCATSRSDGNYADFVRTHVKRYDGIDIMNDPHTAEILDNYYVGNAVDYPFDRKYDVVICVSVIEHAGLSTYKKTNPKEERDNLFKRCLELSNKYLWISFPTGLPYTYPDQLSVITEDQLKYWESLVKNFKVTERFLHNSAGPQAGTPWREHRKREAACLQQYFDYIGDQSITILEVEK